MAEECTENSIATTSSSIHNWWHDLHACSLTSWGTSSNTWQNEPKNNNSESSGEENISISTSFTNTSNHSELSADSVRSLVESTTGAGNEFVGETVASDNHLWNHLLLSVGCPAGELHNQDVEQISLDGKNISATMFNPTCDYSKKVDDSWGFSSLTSFNVVKNQLNVLGEGSMESPRESKSSDMVVNWQIPHQDATINNDLQVQPCNLDLCDVRNFGSVSCFGHDMKLLAEKHGGIDESWTTFGKPSDINGIQYPRNFSNMDLRDSRRSYSGLPNTTLCTNSRSFTDLIATPSYLNKPLLDINLSKPFLKTLDLSGCRKQAFKSSPFPSPTSICKTPTKRNGRTQGSEGRKGSSEDNSEPISKKPKQETSAAVSSTKGQMQVPKVKLGDKITALQQIVSPFGKTDTASVLWEAIGYIRFLQEQIQLLSTPYLKGCASKDLWGGLERKDRGEGKLDLKSRGLCLVPISCTPQVYPDTSGCDYLTPVYRGCLYR